MAFDINGLTLMVPAAAGQRVYRYTSTDAAPTWDTYFDDAAAAPHLAAGDIVIGSWATGGTPVGEIAVVTASDGVSAVTFGAIVVDGV